MKIAAFIITLLMINAVSAQSKFKFHSQNYIGVLGGETEAAFQIQTINGLQRGTWFGGIGTGLDYYYQRSVPLFLSFTKYLTARPLSLFISLDGGTNYLLDKSTANSFNGYRDNGDFSPSLYYGAHAGYKIELKKNKGSVLMSFGYSAKRLKEKIKTVMPCFTPPCPEYDEKYDYRLNRFSFRMGWMF